MKNTIWFRNTRSVFGGFSRTSLVLRIEMTHVLVIVEETESVMIYWYGIVSHTVA